MERLCRWGWGGCGGMGSLGDDKQEMLYDISWSLEERFTINSSFSFSFYVYVHS